MLKKLCWVVFFLFSLMTITTACDSRGRSEKQLLEQRNNSLGRTAEALNIDVSPSVQGDTFGFPATVQTAGQTLTVPANAPLLRTIAFKIDADAGLALRAHVYTWNVGAHRADVLKFTSTTQAAIGGLQTYTFNVGDLDLAGITQVVAFITVSGDPERATNNGGGHVYHSGIGNSTYGGGQLVTLASDAVTNIADWTGTAWTEVDADLGGTFLFVAQSSIALSANPAASTLGTSVTFTATVTGDSPTGSVSFLDNGLQIGTGTISSGVATFTTSALTIGTHPITATYAGDLSNIGPATSNQLNYVVSAAATTTALTGPGGGTTVWGESATFTAHVTSPSGTPTGTVTFKDGATLLETKTVDGSGFASTSTAALEVGAHTITADFTGSSATYPNSSATPLAHTVNKAATTTTVGSSVNPSKLGQLVTFTANIAITSPGAGNPAGGTVTFKDGTTTLGTGTVQADRSATFSTSAQLALGGHTITAEYAGDSHFSASTSSGLSQVVSLDTTQVALSPNPASTTYGQNVTFTATVTADTAGSGPLTGTVTFTDSGTTLPNGDQVAVNGSGVAQVTLNTLSVATHSITATYSGDASHAVGAQTINFTVNAATPTVTLASLTNPTVFGQSTTLTATVTGTGALVPTGTVRFTDTTTAANLGDVTLNGAAQATLPIASLSVATHAIVATYQGNSTYGVASSSALNQVVNMANTLTNVASSTNPSLVGFFVTFTATVTALTPGAGTPAGTVTFRDGTNPLGTANLDGSGVAVFATNTLASGTHAITAQYNGSASFAGSNSVALTQTVNQAGTSVAVTSSQTPAAYGTSLSFTATVSSTAGLPTGTVTFSDGATALGNGTLNGAGVATFTTAALAGGVHTITGRYNGDASHVAGSTGSVSQVINPATTTTALVSSLNPSTFGQSVVLTATVTSGVVGGAALTGTVAFRDGATTLSTVALVNGSAALTTSALTAATHSITAVFSGDTNYATSTSAVLSQVVNKSATSTTVVSSSNPSLLGTKVTFTATVVPTAPGAGTRTGSVTFKSGASTLGTGTVSTAGIATFETSTLAEGTFAITAEYGGDANFNPSTSPVLSQRVSSKAATIVLVATPKPSTYGSNVTFTATLSGGAGLPTGTIEFREGPSTLGSGPLVEGVATFTKANLAAGTHTLVAAYSGDATYATGTGAVAHVVNKAPTTIAITSNANPAPVGTSVIITASVSSAGAGFTGQVEFLDAQVSLGKIALTGTSAAITLGSLKEGQHALSAVYSGDINFDTSTATALTQTITPGAPSTSGSTTSSSGSSGTSGGPPAEDEGCGCRVIKPDSSSDRCLFALGALAVSLTIVRRRRRR